MRRFLRGLRKSFKTACLTTALVTCWNIGQTTQAAPDPPSYGDEVTVHFSGTVSPDTNDVSHLFLIYGSGFSGDYGDFHAVKLGDSSAGETNNFSIFETAVYQDELVWFAAGLYGDISGGQYVEGLNGVTLVVSAKEGDPWNGKGYIPEETMFQYLLNDDYNNLAGRIASENVDYDFFSPGQSWDMFDFSSASKNGQMFLQFEIVPEPVTLVLLGGGWVFVVASRRQKY